MIGRESLKALLAAARKTDWRDALSDEFVAEQDSVNLRLTFCDESRGAWKVHLPTSARGRLLLASGGVDCLGIALARWCKQVVVCHPDEDFLSLMKLRADELGLCNVRSVCLRDDASFPFSDKSFDAVVVKTGLASNGWPRPSAEVLNETRRILKNNGCLVLQADNRWTLRRGAVGSSDSKSRRGYDRLVRGAGFGTVRFCEPLRQPTVSARDNWSRRFKKRLRRKTWLADSFNILAATERLDESWVEGLTTHVAREIGLPSESVRARIRLSGAHSAGLILYLDRQCVVRVPLEPDSQVRVARNFEGLGVARDWVRPAAAVRTPDPMLAGTYAGNSFSVESHVEGRSLDRVDPRVRVVEEERMFELLLALKRIKGVATDAAQPQSRWSEHVVQPLVRAISWTTTEEQRRLAAEVAGQAADLDASCIPSAFSHGDFKWANMLVAGSDPGLALVDWDRWDHDDLVTHDLLHFICNHRKLRDGCDWPRAFADWLDGTGTDEQEQRWTRCFAEDRNLGHGWEMIGGLAYWAREIASSAGTVYDLDRVWIRKTFLELLPRFHAKLTRRS